MNKALAMILAALAFAAFAVDTNRVTMTRLGSLNPRSGEVVTDVTFEGLADATNVYTKAETDTAIAGKADREIVIGQEKGLPGDCFPIAYVYNGDSYSIVNSGGIVVDQFGPAYYRLADSVTGVAVCYFRISDGTYFSNGEASGITFGGTAPTQRGWPVLCDVATKSSVMYDVDVKTNYYDKAETEAKIVELAPAPGDYVAVSNAAMNAAKPVMPARLRMELPESGQYVEPKNIFGQYVFIFDDDAPGNPTVILNGERYFISSAYGDAEGHFDGLDNILIFEMTDAPFDEYEFRVVLSPVATIDKVDQAAQAIPPAVSNVVTKAYVENLGIDETDPTVPQWAKASAKPTYTASEVGALPSAGGTLLGNLTVESTGEKSEIRAEHGNEYIALQVKDNKATIETSDYSYAMPNSDGTVALTKNIPNVPEWALAAQKPTYTASEVGATSPEAVSNIVSTAYVRTTLGVWMEYDEATGFYYYCHEEE